MSLAWFIWACAGDASAEPTAEELKAAAASATDALYLASGKLLECLGKGRTQDTSVLLKDVREQFGTARAKYDILLKSPRAGSNVVPPTNGVQLVSFTQATAALQLALKRPLSKEGLIAEATQEVIDKTVHWLEKVPNCKVLRGDKNALLDILENKILLERAAQLNEIVTAN